MRGSGFGGPGPNQWSDSAANVSVDNGDLVLSIVQDSSGRWTCPELSLPTSLGYGTYRWVVDSDLRGIDANEVLGLFTYGGPSPSNNEIDIEAAHWGNLAWPNGSGTVWFDAVQGLRASQPFNYAGTPPYLQQFTWSPGSIHYLVLDSTGATVFDWSTTSGVPVPSTEKTFINYWRFGTTPPTGPRSMRLASFTWLPPGDPATLPPMSGTVAGGGVAQPPPAGGGTQPASTPPTTTAKVATPAAPRLSVAVRPSRFALRGRHAGARILWDASALARVRIEVERRLHRGGFTPVGAVTRSVPAGHGAMRFPARVGGHTLLPGSYRLQLSSSAAGVRFARRLLAVRVTGASR